MTQERAPHTFVVSHTSDLVTYLVASCLVLYYGRNTHVRVVHVYDTPLRTTPWCGVSTVSNMRIAHWAFLQSAFLHKLLKPCLVTLDLVRVEKAPPRRYKPDFAVWNQHSAILARVSATRPSHGLFYHPDQVAQVLLAFLAGLPNVSFSSVASVDGLSHMVRSVAPSVWVNLTPQARAPKPFDSQVLVNSRLSAVDFVPPAAVRRESLPGSVLWLPLFRASAGLRGSIVLRSEVAPAGAGRVVTVHRNCNELEDEIASRYDLFYGLGICGSVLCAVGGAGSAPRL